MPKMYGCCAHVFLLRFPLTRLTCQNKGNTACHYCFSFGYKNLGNYLISKGAATNIVNQAGETVDQMRVAVATEKKKPA